MIAKQVRFRCPDIDSIEGKKGILGGIAVYDGYDFSDQNLKCVICGCCGGTFKPDEVEILRGLDWLSISNEILGE